jgi:hypothetical protein
MTRLIARAITHCLTILALLWSGAALAEVRIHFHSFNGSVLFGRYPHAFVVLEGTLEETGQAVNENYGFSARRVTPAILSGPVEHMILSESDKNIRKTNRHFTLSLSDEQYRKVIDLVASWQNAPGKFYDLEKRNCIHFVGEIAKVVGLRVDYPDDMLRRPKKWLNRVAQMNPRLGAQTVR